MAAEPGRGRNSQRPGPQQCGSNLPLPEVVATEPENHRWSTSSSSWRHGQVRRDPHPHSEDVASELGHWLPLGTLCGWIAKLCRRRWILECRHWHLGRLTTATWAPTTRTSSTLGMMMDGMAMLGTMVKLTTTATTRTGPSTTTMAGMKKHLKKMEVNKKRTPATTSQRRRSTSRAREKADIPPWALDVALVEANGTIPTRAPWTGNPSANPKASSKDHQKDMERTSTERDVESTKGIQRLWKERLLLKRWTFWS